MKNENTLRNIIISILFIFIVFTSATEGAISEEVAIFCILINIIGTTISINVNKIEPTIINKVDTANQSEKKTIINIEQSMSNKLAKIGITNQIRFVEKLETIFRKFLISTNSSNIKLLYNLSSKEIAENTIEMITTYKKDGYKNKIENITISSCDVIDVNKSKKHNTVTLRIKVRLSDYLVNNENKVVKGNNTKVKTRTYTITYTQEDEKHKQNECKCNNCGALYGLSITKCPYCRTITNNNLKPREWYISKITVESESNI